MHISKKEMICFIVIILLSVIMMGCIDSEPKLVSEEDILYKGFRFEWIERTENNDFQLLIVQIDEKNPISIDMLHFNIYGLDKSDSTNYRHPVVDIYMVPINDKNFISFQDNDLDGMLTVGDSFIIKSTDHVDDDGSTDSPGRAEEGFLFIVWAKKSMLFETLIR